MCILAQRNMKPLHPTKKKNKKSASMKVTALINLVCTEWLKVGGFYLSGLSGLFWEGVKKVSF